MPPRAKDLWLPMLVIHASMMASVIMYGIIGYTVTEELPPTAPVSHGPFLAIMAGAAAVCALLSFLLRARMMPPRERIGDGRTFDHAVLATDAGRAALGKLRGALIVSWALCEAVAIMGLVPTLLFHDVSQYAPFGAAALVLLMIHAPRPKVLVEIMNALPR